MLKHRRLLEKENENLHNQNSYLERLVLNAEERVQEIAASLQKGHLDIMPSLTVCSTKNESSENKPERSSIEFLPVGHFKLPSPAISLADGPFVAAGQKSGDISLIAANQAVKIQESHSGRTSPSGLFRFSFTGSAEASEMTNPLTKAANPLKGHTDAVNSVIWDDSGHLSSISMDSTLRIWDITTAQSSCAALKFPSISHAIHGGLYIVASCTKSVEVYDPRTQDPELYPTNEAISSVCSSDLGLIMGSTEGSIILYDLRMRKPYQTLQISPTGLPISRISGGENITVTCFDGAVRLLGQEIPLFVEREYFRAQLFGSTIGSCCVQLENRDDFVVCGSYSGIATVWTSKGSLQILKHSGRAVYDCVRLGKFVGSFLTSDDSGSLTMFACSFSPSPITK